MYTNPWDVIDRVLAPLADDILAAYNHFANP